ncbi:cytoplasmic tRNA 2-thiolation protein 2 [Pseudohyphozyma bogoriensis]|nr:cytoplasmic tRNA 2-thiolation protein 2 [Pseudohyphozyma bogoriensis]
MLALGLVSLFAATALAAGPPATLDFILPPATGLQVGDIARCGVIDTEMGSGYTRVISFYSGLKSSESLSPAGTVTNKASSNGCTISTGTSIVGNGVNEAGDYRWRIDGFYGIDQHCHHD